MTARLASAALAVLVSAIVPGAAAGAEGSSLLHQVARKYADVRTLSATFRQEVPLQNVGVVRKASGTVYFQRPLRMRWDYRAPAEQLFLADGTNFYFRPPGSSRVFRKRLEEDVLGGRIPLLLLFGKGDITEFFRVTETIPLQGKAQTVLRLAPKGDGAPEVRRVDLVVDDADLAIREIHLYDRLGGANHLYLEAIVLNPTLPEGIFRFRMPPDAEMVDE